MSLVPVQEKLADAYQLLDFSEKLLDDIESAPLSDLPRILQLLRKNIRDAKALINDAEATIDDTVREIDRQEELEAMKEEYRDLIMADEWEEKNLELLRKQGFGGGDVNGTLLGGEKHRNSKQGCL